MDSTLADFGGRELFIPGCFAAGPLSARPLISLKEGVGLFAAEKAPFQGVWGSFRTFSPQTPQPPERGSRTLRRGKSPLSGGLGVFSDPSPQDAQPPERGSRMQHRGKSPLSGGLGVFPSSFQVPVGTLESRGVRVEGAKPIAAAFRLPLVVSRNGWLA